MTKTIIEQVEEWCYDNPKCTTPACVEEALRLFAIDLWHRVKQLQLGDDFLNFGDGVMVDGVQCKGLYIAQKDILNFIDDIMERERL